MDEAVFPASLASFRILADSTLRVTFDVEPVHAQDFLSVFFERGAPAFIARANARQSPVREQCVSVTESPTQRKRVQSEESPVGEERASLLEQSKVTERAKDAESPAVSERADPHQAPDEKQRVASSQPPMPIERARDAQPPTLPERPNGPYSSQAHALHRSGFFYQVDVWRATGTDEDYQAWARREPCCVCKALKRAPMGDSEFAHVRRAGEAGVAYKPQYKGVPMCHTHHALQHQRGERAVFALFAGTDPAPAEAKAWFEQQAVAHAYAWCRQAIKEQLFYAHWYDVPPETLLAWAELEGVERYLPEEYRLAATEEDRDAG